MGARGFEQNCLTVRRTSLDMVILLSFACGMLNTHTRTVYMEHTLPTLLLLWNIAVLLEALAQKERVT